MSLALLGAGGATDASHLTAYGQLVKSLNPDLYWALDNKSRGSDLSGNNRHGTGVGTITLGAAETNPITGETHSTDLNGTDAYISSTYSPFTAATTRTFAGWAYRESSDGADTLVAGNGGATAPNIALLPGTDVYFDTANGVSTPVVWTAAWPGNDEWVHWAFIFNDGANTVTLYINGELVSAEAHAGTYATPGNLAVGAWFGVVNPFDGKMAHTAVWHSAVSAENIALLATP